MCEPAICCRGVGKIWAAGTERAHEALRGIDLTVEDGEFVVVLGPSGCGKSTLLYLIAGLEETSAGEITAHGIPVTGPAPDRSLIFQETSLFPWLSVWQNVSFGLSLRGLGKAEQREISRQVLLRTGLAETFDKRPHELSGGMRQRVAVARALAMRPKVLLMDEPFAALDVQTRAKMQGFLLDVWRESGASVIFVTHHIDEAMALADRVVVCTARPGRIKDIVAIDRPRPRDPFAADGVVERRSRPRLRRAGKHRHRLRRGEVPSSVIRGLAVITEPADRRHWQQIDDGAVLQRDGVIAEIGPFAELSARHPDVPVIGTGRQVVLPGFVNGHHHIGLTPVQHGSPDMPLELWFVTRLVTRQVDLYLDTLYSAFEMIASGITTVQHLHGWLPGGLAAVEAGAGEVIRAYEDIGMRVSYSFALRDQNRLVYQDDEQFTASLPAELRPAMERHFARFQVSLADYGALFEQLHAKHHDKERVKIQLAPANLHWCSDAALTMLADYSERYDAPMHMHLVETAYQKEYARRRGGGTALDHIDRFGFLGPRLTLGHGVWLNEADLDRIAATGTHICHNCSSNFRLRSGLAPLNFFEQRGINTAIGLDEAGINDDRDMLQEMRMVLRAHRVPGMDEEDVTSVGQVLRMATVGGAITTPFGSRIGNLAVGSAADLVLIDWDKIAYPYLDPETPILDAVVQRGRTDAVDLVMVAGEVVYRDGRFTRVDRDAALRELHQSLQRPLADDEVERRQLSKTLLPYVRRFYAGYFDPEAHLPYYRGSSRQ